jgi:hypothetical protein
MGEKNNISSNKEKNLNIILKRPNFDTLKTRYL